MNDNTDNPLNNRRVRVHYRFGENELDVEGEPQEVDKHTLVFLRLAAPADRAVQLRLPMPVEQETPLLGKSNGASAVISGNGHTDQPHDLCSFYLEKAPKGQYQEVAVITYFYQTFRGREYVTRKDYEEAYKELLRIPVKPPKDINGSVRNTATRTKHLSNLGSGKFILTMQGEELVQKMGVDKQD